MWNAVKRGLSWLREHWYVPLFAAGIVLGWVVSGKVRRRGTVAKQTKAELAVVRAGVDAKRLEAELDTVEATAKVEEQYRDEMAKLDEKQKREASRLAGDPRALARFLVRAGSRQSKPL